MAKQFLFSAVVLLALVGCSTTDKGIPDMTPEALYQKGYEAFAAHDYAEASKYFDEVERQHPYSIWSGRAQIMSAYAFYQKNEYDDAVLALDRFIQLHPGNRNTPYAYYLKGLCYYEQISDIRRDQKMTVLALQTFRDLLARFPDTIYTPDVLEKLKLIQNHLAGQELAVGRYYLKRQDPLPAMNRFQEVIRHYSDSDQVFEAYYRLGVCYTMLGMTSQAREVEAALAARGAGSPWLIKLQHIIGPQRSEK